VIFDADKRVCSLPPIINGEHSKITLNTKNVFIECTGTDATKLSVTLNQVVTMFSQYASEPFVVEPVLIVDEETGKVLKQTPDLTSTNFTAEVDYINSAIGIDITGEQMVDYLRKMSMTAILAADKKSLSVAVPPTRSDVLHAADLMEDIAISYGFNAIKKTLPQCYTTGKYHALNALTDSLREAVAQSGFNEVLTWVLLSFDDNYRFMQPKDVQGVTMDIKAAQASAAAAGQAVSSQLLDKPLVVHPYLLESQGQPITLANPKSLDFQLVRTTLLPGLLKALANNQGQVNLPIRLFEVGDVGFQDPRTDVGARNQRRLAALYCDNNKSGFETIQGLLDRVMLINGVRFGPAVREHRANQAKLEAKRKANEAAAKKAAAAAAAAKAKAAKKAGPAAGASAAAAAAEEKKQDGVAAEEEDDSSASASAAWAEGDTFTLRPSSHPSFFPGRRADILLHRLNAAKDAAPIVVGQFGILHPDVLAQFQIPYVCSALEINLEHFL
jgi:phenylalanyl-tRNA synthetase beta chain